VQGLGDPGDLSLLEVGRLTGVHPQLLLYYCRLGLLAPADGHLWDGPTFDRDAVAQVLRIEHYRDTLGVKRRALHLICELWREAERQQIDLEFLHANSARH
jgi:DNA-binding transcriptional MerR regulator